MKCGHIVAMFLVGLAACEVAPVGPVTGLIQSPGGATRASAPSATPPVMVWVDSTETQVPNLQWSGDTADALFLAGVAWWMDVETATVDIARHQVSTLYFVAGDCSSQALISAPLARMPFKVPGETAYRWRPHTMASSLTSYSAIQVNGGGCTPSSGSLRTIPLDASTIPPYTIQTPSAVFAPPLHLEQWVPPTT